MTINIQDNNSILEYITEILNDEEKMNQLANISYIHVNGFAKIPIYKDSEKIIRIHIWMKNNKERQNPHSHGWSFNSKIIKGRFINQIYEDVTENKESYNDDQIVNKNIILLNKNDHLTNMEFQNKAKLRISTVDFLYENDSYSMQSKDIHTYYPIDDMSITIIEATVSHDDFAYVYSIYNLPKTNRIPNIDVDKLRYYLNYIISWIKCVNMKQFY